MADKRGDKDLDLGEVYSKTELFLDKNKNAIMIAAVAVVAVVAALIGYKRFYAEPRAEEAAEMMWKPEYYFEIDSLDRAIEGDENYLGFGYIASEYGGTPSGNLANFYLGSIYMQKGEYDLAIEHYKKADLDDEVLQVMAIGNIGDALVELGNIDKAIAQFEKAANMEDNEMLTPLYLMKAGILYQQNNQWNKAASTFKRIADKYPAAAEAAMARKYLAQAEALAG